MTNRQAVKAALELLEDVPLRRGETDSPEREEAWDVAREAWIRDVLLLMLVEKTELKVMTPDLPTWPGKGEPTTEQE